MTWSEISMYVFQILSHHREIPVNTNKTKNEKIKNKKKLTFMSDTHQHGCAGAPLKHLADGKRSYRMGT